MQQDRQLFAFALACLVGSACPKAAVAQGGAPLLTEDPYTPGYNIWEINLAATVEQRGRTGTGKRRSWISIMAGVSGRN